MERAAPTDQIAGRVVGLDDVRVLGARLQPAHRLGVCTGGEQIILEVRPGPTYRINSTELAPVDLAAKLRAIYDPRPDKVIEIAGYPGVRYDDVVQVIDVAKSAGVRVVGLTPRESYLGRK